MRWSSALLISLAYRLALVMSPLVARTWLQRVREKDVFNQEQGFVGRFASVHLKQLVKLGPENGLVPHSGSERVKVAEGMIQRIIRSTRQLLERSI